MSKQQQSKERNFDRQMAEIVTDYRKSVVRATAATDFIRVPRGMDTHGNPALNPAEWDDICGSCGYPIEWCRCFGG